MKHFGIATRLGLLLAAFGVLAVALTGYYTHASSARMLRAAAEDDLLTATRVVGDNMQIYLEQANRNARLLASLPAARRTLEQPGSTNGIAADVLAEVFESLLSVHSNYAQVRLIDARRHGLETVRVDRIDGTLQRIEGDALQEKAHFPYVFETLRRQPGEVYVSDIALDREDGRQTVSDLPVLRVASPVRGSDGQAAGLVVINLDVRRYFQQLRDTLPANYRVYLANHHGDILAHPDVTQTFGFDRGARVFVQDIFPPVGVLFDGQADSLIVNSAADGRTGQATAFVRLPFGDPDDGRFLVLGLSQPLNELLALFDQQRRRALELVLLFSALAVVLSALLARAVTGPVNAMAQAVTAFSRGERASRLPVKRQDELGVLARSVELMQTQITSQIDELERSRNEMDHLAHHDALTGLPDRRLFLGYLDAAIARARRSGKPFALLFVDLDRFKEINDELGHTIGDAVLRAVAERLRSHVRADDTVARLGGDEFTVLYENLETPHDAELIAAKLHESFQHPLHIGEHALQVRASIGVSLYPDHGGEATELLSSADSAMYRTKLAGRDGFHLYGEDTGHV